MRDLPPEASFVPLAAVNKYRNRPTNGTAVHSSLEPDDGLLEATAWHGKIVPGRKWIVDGMIPRDEVTMITGNGGEGKSLLTMQLLVAATAGGSWLGREVPNVRVLGVYCEDDEDELHRRTNGILDGDRRSFADCDGLTLVCRKGLNSVMYEAGFNDMQGQTTEFFNRLKLTAQQLGAEIIVLDSLYNFFAGNENNRAHANQFVNALCDIAKATGGAVVLVSHPSLSGMGSGSGTAGNTAWHNAVRSRLYLHRKKHPSGDPEEIGPLVLEDMKQNYGPKNGEIEVRYDNGRFVDVGPQIDTPPFDNTAFNERTGGLV